MPGQLRVNRWLSGVSAVCSSLKEAVTSTNNSKSRFEHYLKLLFRVRSECKTEPFRFAVPAEEFQEGTHVVVNLFVYHKQCGLTLRFLVSKLRKCQVPAM
jgi:hypothetical protein